MESDHLEYLKAKCDHIEYFQAESDYIEYFQVESDYLQYFWWKDHYTVHGVPQARDKAFCTLCEKLNQQKTWDGGYKPVTSENLREGTGDSEDGGDKYQDFISWFKKDKCWQPSWLDRI